MRLIRWPVPIWSRLSLRARLILIFYAIISLLLGVEIVAALSREVADLDYRVATNGTILAQSVASACGTLMQGRAQACFDGPIARVRRSVDLVEIAIVDRDRRIVAHSDPSRVGGRWTEGSFGVFSKPRASPGFRSLLRDYTEYEASAPVVSSTTVLGFVWLRYRSNVVSERAFSMVRSAAGIGALLFLIGAIIATVYVRHITRPLAELTAAATAVSEDRIDEVHIDLPESQDEVGMLQASFGRLVAALQNQRADNATLLAEQARLNERLRGHVDDMKVDLTHTTAYLQAVLGCMGEGVVTCDADGLIVHANPGARIQLGELGEPVVGTPISRIVPDGAPIGEAVHEAVSTGHTSELELVRMHGGRAAATGPTRNRGQATLVFRVYPLHSSEEAPFGAVVIVVDETLKRETEKSLRRHDRLISLGTTAAGLAHELGNFMHTINGFSSMVLRGMAPDDPWRRDVEHIHHDNAQAIGVLDRFLLFARPSEGQYRQEPVDALVRDAIELCAFKLHAQNVRVIEHLGLPDQLVRCDSKLIRQVIVNLVLNAIDALDQRRSPSITVVSCLGHHGQVVIAVSDTGSGIAPENLERIFDPFFTTKMATGTGLGLSIANQVVERHGGKVQVTSKPNVGTTFTVTLPIDRPKGDEL